MADRTYYNKNGECVQEPLSKREDISLTHVHIYHLKGMLEIDVEESDMDKALRLAMEMGAKIPPEQFIKPDRDFLAVTWPDGCPNEEEEEKTVKGSITVKFENPDLYKKFAEGERRKNEEVQSIIKAYEELEDGDDSQKKEEDGS